MARKIKHLRSKSTSNVLNEPVTDTIDHPVNSTCSQINSENSISSFSDQLENKSPVTKTPSGLKSQNFFKRLFPNREKKNDLCEADDEFITQYYRKIQPSGANNPCESVNYLQFPYMNYPTYTRAHNYCIAYEEYEQKKVKVCGEQLCDNIYCATCQNKTKCSVVENGNNEIKSYDQSNINYTTCDNNSKVKINRKKSFKNFFELLVKWRVSANKRNSQSFISCEDLTHNGIESNVTHDNLSRTVSLRSVILDKKGKHVIHDYNEPVNSAWTDENEQQKQVIEETRRIFSKQRSRNSREKNSDELLVRPSVVKNISRRFSQPPEILQRVKQNSQLAEKRSIYPDQRYSSGRFVSEIYEHSTCSDNKHENNSYSDSMLGLNQDYCSMLTTRM